MSVKTSRQNGQHHLRMNDLATIREVQAINEKVLDVYHTDVVERLEARIAVLEARAARPWWRFWS